LPPWADDRARQEGEDAQAYACQTMAQFDCLPPTARAVTRATNNLTVTAMVIKAGVRSETEAEPIVRRMLERHPPRR
jgi:hypothetical protein